MNIARSAVISDCGQYRYRLSRLWDTRVPRLIFIGLNPSTADATSDDPTVRRLISFAREFGYGAFDLLNLFALRATDPRKLQEHSHPVGPENDDWLFGQVGDVVVCWGTPGVYLDRGRYVANRIKQQLYCFGINQNGTPKHPLYLPKDTVLRRYHA